MPDRPEMNGALPALEARLALVCVDYFEPAAGYGPMDKALRDVIRVFESPIPTGNQNRVADAITAFRRTRNIPDFLSLKYVCLGVGDIRNGWCVLCDPELREITRSRCEEGNLRQRMKTFQGLLRSYLGFPKDDTQTPAAAVQGWAALRTWLSGELASLGKGFGQDPICRIPQWFTLLQKHGNLLSASPCAVYGADLLKGNAAALEEVRAGLAIPHDSWVMSEAVLAQVNYVIGLDDSSFREVLDRILIVIFGKTEFKVSRQLATRCVALLVSRYARCGFRPESIALRDAAIESIGNPWLRKQAWDAYVLDAGGKPDDDARNMILGWLRQRLIKDFFELLSEDRAADTRRLTYWLRFEPAIEDMWFILGNQARRSSDPDYVEFRKRARGRVLALSGQTNPSNNAFVMRIGRYVAVEFGLTGNACFLIEFDDLPKLVARKLTSGTDQLEVEIDALRGGIKLIHRDSPTARESWEMKFDNTVVPVLQFRPAQPPYSIGHTTYPSAHHYEAVFHPISKGSEPPRTATTPLFSWLDVEKFVAEHNLRVEDNRRRGGAYWVMAAQFDPAVTHRLRSWGFQWKAGKGWWKE